MHNIRIFKTNFRNGFSLVELLVSMAIIAVLISIAAYGINIVQRNARDTRRRKVIENAQMVFLDAETSTGYTPKCFGSIGRVGTTVESNGLGFFSGAISGGYCTGTRVGSFVSVNFKVNGVRNTGCTGYLTRETSSRNITICFDPINKIIGTRLEGSNTGFQIAVN